MDAKNIIRTEKIDGRRMKITIELDLQGDLMLVEEQLQQTLNVVGTIAVEHALQRLDADGAPIKVGHLRFTSKGKSPQTYESLFGPVDVERHVYQSQHGGQTFCPLENTARMILNATPKYAKVVAAKYAAMGATSLRDDLIESNARPIAHSYAKALADYVGDAIAAKESRWEYDLPDLPRPVASVAVGLDGTCMLMRNDGWRQAMCGSISFYDADGERMHTLYAGASPEYGKATFLARFDRELERVKRVYPDALYIGLADGASDNWTWLTPRTGVQLVDFWHAREYVGKAARAMFSVESEREAWEADWSHRLKHDRDAVSGLVRELGKANRMLESPAKGRVKVAALEEVKASRRYFANHRAMMRYWEHVERDLPIGSGVTEAACKTLIKQRLCQSGMRWSEDGASSVIVLRALRMSDGRWDQFWEKVMRYGI